MAFLILKNPLSLDIVSANNAGSLALLFFMSESRYWEGIRLKSGGGIDIRLHRMYGLDTVGEQLLERHSGQS